MGTFLSLIMDALTTTSGTRMIPPAFYPGGNMGA